MGFCSLEMLFVLKLGPSKISVEVVGFLKQPVLGCRVSVGVTSIGQHEAVFFSRLSRLKKILGGVLCRN